MDPGSAMANSEGRKSTKKEKCSHFAVYFHIWWLKMQNCLSSLRLPALFIIIFKPYLTQKLRKALSQQKM